MLFHLGQSVWPKVQAKGLQTLYSEDENISLHINQLLVLAFVPLNDIEEAFEDLRERKPQKVRRGQTTHCSGT